MPGNGPNLGAGSLTSSRHKLLKVGAITASEVTQYTAPVGQSVEIKSAAICNTTAGALTLSLSVVPKSTAIADGNRLYKAFSVAANATVELTALKGVVVTDEDFISALGSAVGLTLTLTGVVYGG